MELRQSIPGDMEIPALDAQTCKLKNGSSTILQSDLQVFKKQVNVFIKWRTSYYELF